MATRTILFRGQTRRKGERTSISGIPLPGIWVAGGVFPQNKGYDYAIIYQQNPKVEKYVVHADTIGQYMQRLDTHGKPHPWLFVGNRITRCFSHGLAMNLAAPPRNPTISIVGGVNMKQAKKTLKISLPGGISMTRIIPHFRLLLTRKP